MPELILYFPMVEESCLNCGQSLSGKFCASCGQRKLTPGIRLREVIEEFLGGLFNMDAPLILTFRSLFLDPGQVGREFIAGKRKRYTAPIRYFLFAVAFYFLIRWITGWDPVLSAVGRSGGTPNLDSPMMQVNIWMSRNVNLLLPLWAIILAALDTLFFRRDPYGYIDRLAYVFFLIGEYILLSSLLIPLAEILPVIQMTNFLVIFGFMIYGLVSFHSGRNFWKVSKAIFIVLFSFAFYVILSMVLVSLFMGFELSEVFNFKR